MRMGGVGGGRVGKTKCAKKLNLLELGLNFGGGLFNWCLAQV